MANLIRLSCNPAPLSHAGHCMSGDCHCLAFPDFERLWIIIAYNPGKLCLPFRHQGICLSMNFQIKWFTTFGPTTTAASCQCNEVGWGSPFFVVPGRFELPPPEFSSGILPLKYRTRILEVRFASFTSSTTPGFCALPLWICRSPGNLCYYLINPCKIYLNLDYFVTPVGLEPTTPALKVPC